MLRRIILTRVRLVMLIVGFAAGVLVLGSFAINEGELVLLMTTDEASRHHETRLWVVDIDGRQFLRAGSSNAGWLARLEAKPLVVLERNEESGSYHAHSRRDEPALLAKVNAAMSEKYGLPDRVISYFSDRNRSVPIELELLREDAVSKVGPRNAH